MDLDDKLYLEIMQGGQAVPVRGSSEIYGPPYPIIIRRIVKMPDLVTDLNWSCFRPDFRGLKRRKMGESFRHDYYQSDITVVLAVYVKNIQQDRVQVELSGNTVPNQPYSLIFLPGAFSSSSTLKIEMGVCMNEPLN